jgi:hypothetical protein
MTVDACPDISHARSPSKTRQITSNLVVAFHGNLIPYS